MKVSSYILDFLAARGIPVCDADELAHKAVRNGTRAYRSVVRAFGKQDLKGATDAWQRLVAVAPQSPEGQQAKQALDSLSSAHGAIGQ